MFDTKYLKKYLAILILFLSTISFGAYNGIHISGDNDLQIIKEKSFNISPGKDLIVDISSGDVMVTYWDKTEVYVKILGNENAMEKMEFTLDGNEEMVRVVGE
ncbi:MAG: hypothetical protein P8X47_11380, partial [Ignavibacteriaceae bacterium]